MYKQIANTTTIFRVSDGASIPADTNNTDYVAVLEWIEAGNTLVPANPPEVYIPKVVTMRQARLALLNAGLLDDVTVAINSLPEPNKTVATIEWEYSQEVFRDKELVQVLGQLLGLTAGQLDDLFIAAVAL